MKEAVDQSTDRPADCRISVFNFEENYSEISRYYCYAEWWFVIVSIHVQQAHHRCCAGGTTGIVAAVVSKSFVLPSLRRCLLVGNLWNNYAPYWHYEQYRTGVLVVTIRLRMVGVRWFLSFDYFSFSLFFSVIHFRTLYPLQFIRRNQNKRAMQLEYIRALVYLSSPSLCHSFPVLTAHLMLNNFTIFHRFASIGRPPIYESPRKLFAHFH